MVLVLDLRLHCLKRFIRRSIWRNYKYTAPTLLTNSRYLQRSQGNSWTPKVYCPSQASYPIKPWTSVLWWVIEPGQDIGWHGHLSCCHACVSTALQRVTKTCRNRVTVDNFSDARHTHLCRVMAVTAGVCSHITSIRIESREIYPNIFRGSPQSLGTVGVGADGRG
jgi:hypothetical protein